jgi:ribonuclease D
MTDPQDGTKSIAPATLITAREHLEEVVVELRQETRLAIDTESNGFYAYQEQVCLLQMSSPREDFIIDPIAVPDLSPLGELMADPRIEKVFHAGEYDVLCLKRDYGFRFANMFDTMIAGRLLGAKELGLAAAIRRYFGVTLSKKLQRADWGLRPLSDAHLTYAQFDTHYLLRLADILKGLLHEKGREGDAAEACAQLAEIEPVIRSFDPEGYWRLSGRSRLSARQMACLREIYLLREHQAKSVNRAPFRIMPEELMLRLAEAMPESQEALAEVRGMTPYLLRRFGGAILAALGRGRTAEPPVEPPRLGRHRSNKEHRLFEQLRQWRKAQAERESVEPIVILDSQSLREITHAVLAGASDPLASLSDLKRRRYGEALLGLINQK